jgi:hypothetical protein
MGVSCCLASFSGDDETGFMQTGRVFLDTRLLEDLAEAVDNRREEPDDVTFAWVRSTDYEEGQPFEAELSGGDLFAPGEVLPSLRYLKQLGEAGDPDVRKIILDGDDEGEYSLEVFQRAIGNELDRLVAFCEKAGTRGDRVALFSVL